MSGLLRFGVSINSELLEKFDKLIESRGYTNRSEAIRDLVRERLVEREWDEDAETIGAVTIVYSHHVRELSESLILDFGTFLNRHGLLSSENVMDVMTCVIV